jgi:hypothetical protein
MVWNRSVAAQSSPSRVYSADRKTRIIIRLVAVVIVSSGGISRVWRHDPLTGGSNPEPPVRPSSNSNVRCFRRGACAVPRHQQNVLAARAGPGDRIGKAPAVSAANLASLPRDALVCMDAFEAGEKSPNDRFVLRTGANQDPDPGDDAD